MPTARSDESHQYQATPPIFHPLGLASTGVAENELFAADGVALTILAAVIALKGGDIKGEYNTDDASILGKGSTPPVSKLAGSFSPLATGSALGVDEVD